MAANQIDSGCIIQCEPKIRLAAGYTRVRVLPENHAKLVILSGVTGKTIQDIVDELLAFALKNVKIEQNDGTIIDLNIGGMQS